MRFGQNAGWKPWLRKNRSKLYKFVDFPDPEVSKELFNEFLAFLASVWIFREAKIFFTKFEIWTPIARVKESDQILVKKTNQNGHLFPVFYI